MKKILFRKLLADCLIFFFISLFSVSIIIWVFQAVNFLDIMIEDGRDYLIYIKYSLLNFPKILSKVLPFVFFFSFLYTITRYELNNELIIFWSFGINKIQLINFFFKFSIILTIFQILLTSVIVPKSQDLARSYLRTSSVNFFESFIKPRKFNDTISELTIYTDKKDKDGNLTNIYLKKGMASDNFQITYAKKGGFRNRDNNPILELFDGETISVANNKITNFKFSKSDLNLKGFKSNTITIIKTQEVTSIELLRCYVKLTNLNLIFKKVNDTNFLNCKLKNLNNITKELYKRFIVPTYLPNLMLIVLLIILKSKENIKYLSFRLLVFFVGFSIIIFSEMGMRLVQNEPFENLEIILTPLIIMMLLYFFYLFKFKILKN